MGQMICSICGQVLPMDDDAIEVMIDYGLMTSGDSILGDHHHLRAHPEFRCEGDPAAIKHLEPLGFEF